MGATVLSKVTSVSQEASLLLSRSKEDSASLFYSWGVYECSCHGDEWSYYRRGSVAFLPLFSLWSFSLHSHSGGTSVSAASEEAAAADKQLSAL